MKKFLPYILIVITLAGLFITARNVNAQTAEEIALYQRSSPDTTNGTCVHDSRAFSGADRKVEYHIKQAACNSIASTSGGLRVVYLWLADKYIAPSDIKSLCSFDFENERYEKDNLTPSECATFKASITGIPVTSTPPAIVPGRCILANNTETPYVDNITQADCTSRGSSDWRPNTNDTGGGTADNNTIESKLPPCGITTGEGISGCLVVIAYYVIYTTPMMLLYVIGALFNAMLAITLSSMIYGSAFISESWRIVRDFSNIFFILILLYISIKMILGLGGAEIKKMIAQVVVVALLINFSMFFTKVVIDASNILALIFYNKITITVNGKNNVPYKPSIKPDRTGVPEKDFAGGIVGAFDPSKGLSEKTFKGAESSYLTLTNFALLAAAPSTGGLSLFYIGGGNKVNVGLFLSVIVVAAIIALLASYALLIASIAFMGRVIELWLCIIFSPFAFMSLAVPKLRGIEYLGWDAWIKRLLGVAFMAPIFMFFLLLITKIIQAPNSLNGLVDKDNPGMAGSIMLVVIPAIIYLSLLYKATEYAKKSSGDFAGAMIKVADGAIKGVAIGAGALALGAATGGVGLAATATLGSAASKLASSSKLIGATTKKGPMGSLARMTLRAAEYGSKSSFNLSKAGPVEGLMKKAGFKTDSGFLKAFGSKTEGGYKGREKRAIELGEERQKRLKVGDDDPLMHEKHEADEKLQRMQDSAADSNDKINAQIDGLEKDLKGADPGSERSKAIRDEINKLIEIQKAITGGFGALQTALIDEKTGEIQKDKYGKVIMVDVTDKNGNKIYATDNGKISKSGIEKVNGDLLKAEEEHVEAQKIKEEEVEKIDNSIKLRITAEDRATKAIDERKKKEKEIEKNPIKTPEDRAVLVALEQAEKSAISAVEDATNNEIKVKNEIDVKVKERTSGTSKKVEELRKKAEEVNKEAKRGTGVSISDIKGIVLPRINNEIRKIENQWKWNEADRIEKKWFGGNRINRKVAHKMRMAAEVKEVAK